LAGVFSIVDWKIILIEAEFKASCDGGQGSQRYLISFPLPLTPVTSAGATGQGRRQKNTICLRAVIIMNANVPVLKEAIKRLVL
jgi:hypothetical protein